MTLCMYIYAYYMYIYTNIQSIQFYNSWTEQKVILNGK